MKNALKRTLIIKIVLIAALAAGLGSPGPARAEWIGPETVVSGTWGSNPGQFHYETGDSFDAFPESFGVDKLGRVSICDPANNRIQRFNANGSIFQILVGEPDGLVRPEGVDSYSWGPEPISVHPSGPFMVDWGGHAVACFNPDGSFVRQLDKITVGKPVGDSYWFYDSGVFSKYSASGEFISQQTDWPLELGVIEEKSLGDGKYKVTITYSDNKYTLTGKDINGFQYARFPNGDLLRYGLSIAERVTPSGVVLGQLQLPEVQTEEVSSIEEDPVFGKYTYAMTYVKEEYGELLVAPNMDLYTWKRTRTTYAIVKWVWRD